MALQQTSLSKLVIPIGALSAIVAVILWFSARALAIENRLTKCETQMDAIREIKEDIKEVKADVRALLIRSGTNTAITKAGGQNGI